MARDSLGASTSSKSSRDLTLKHILFSFIDEEGNGLTRSFRVGIPVVEGSTISVIYKIKGLSVALSKEITIQ